MKPSLLRPFALCLLLAGAAGSLSAATPTVASIKADQVRLGETMTLRAEVADADANLQTVSFHVSGPGITAEQLLGTHNVSGAAATAERTWTPPALGEYTIRVAVGDTHGGSGSASRTTRAFAARSTIAKLTLPTGETQVYSAQGEVRTKENTAALEVVAESGSTMIFWAQTRVVLKPGFRARSGADFWAAVDSDLDGYSDQEEATDSDGDGMFDAWEYDHGLNLFLNDTTGDLDNDGRNNLAEFRAGTDPRNRADAGQLPGGFRLVLRLPDQSYAGIKTDHWQFQSGVAAP